MQKFRRLIFPLLTLCFLLLLVGFFLGRNTAEGPGLRLRRTASPGAEAAESAPGPAERTLLPSETVRRDSGPGEPARLELNHAALEQLTELPGIGRVLAQRIIDYRSEHGPFRYTTDLMNVKGIGEKTFSGLRDLIYVEDNHEDPDN